MENIKIWTGEMGPACAGRGYKLLDCGDKKKLEEVGEVRIVRSEPRAWWKPQLSKTEWDKAVAIFDKEEKGKWEFRLRDGKEVPNDFIIDVMGGIKAKIKFGGGSKHIGIFPEQIKEWEFIKEKIENGKNGRLGEINLLNLFGYTGMATLVAAKAGAKVTHIDASKASIDWARENQKLSELEDKPIRWILDDALKFIKKEVRQGKRYDVIIMDPPSYGRGPKGEVWKIEEKLPDLLSACREILSDDPLFIIFNMYSTELSPISIANLLQDVTKDLDGAIESGELAIRQQNSERLLPMSIFALWYAK